MTIIHKISRRQFIATSLTAAGGFALGIGTGGRAEAAALSVRPWSDDLPLCRRDQRLGRDQAR